MNGQYSLDNNSRKSADSTAPSSPEMAAQDPMLEAVLHDFRASVRAWSEAKYRSGNEAAYRGKSLVLSPVPHRTLWNRSLAWSLSLALALGAGSATFYEYHQQQLARAVAAQREADHQRQLAAAQHTREVDDLLAMVDSDVSREVPSAMEALANPTSEDESQ